MSSRHVFGLAAALLLLAGAAALVPWITSGGGGGTEAAWPSADESNLAEPGPGAPDGGGLDLDSPNLVEDGRDVQKRAEVGRAWRWWGRVLDDHGDPVAGAEVRWSSIAQGGGRSSRVPFAERTVTTDTEGLYRFRETDEEQPVGESVLWVTHPGFLGRFHALPSAQSFLRVDFELERAAPCRVRVLGSGGEPVEAAVVVQSCVPDSSDGASVAARARAVFERRFVTDEQGLVAWVPMEGRVRLVARLGDRSSRPWIGTAPAEVELRFEGGFRLTGIVRLEGQELLEGELRVRVERVLGNLHDVVDEVIVGQDGHWGPLEVRQEPADLYVVRAGGGNAIPVEETFAPPGAGEERFIDLSTRVGSDLWFVLFRGQSDELLEDGEVAVRWWDGERYVVQRERPGAERYIRVRGIPDGQVFAMATSPGFIPTRWGPGLVPEEKVEAHGITMLPTGSVGGTVLDSDGVPVGDFEILGWSTSQYSVTRRWEFRGREDGSFLIEDPFLGDISLVASTPSARSASTAVKVRAGERSETVLRLQEPAVGTGRVVDPEGRPLPSARIQFLITQGEAIQGPWGVPHQVDPDGRFELKGFPRSSSSFEVWAPGYARRVYPVDGRVQPLELGNITLSPRQALTLRLDGPSSCDPTRYTMSSVDPRVIPMRRFPPSGVLTYDAIDPGDHWITIGYPDGSRAFGQIRLQTGEEWDLALRLCGTSRIIVEVGEHAPAPGSLGVVLIRADPVLGSMERGVGAQLGSRVSFGQLPAGGYRVLLTDLGSKAYRERFIELSEGEERTVSLAGDGRLDRVRVVNAEGQSLAGVDVRVRWGDAGKRLGVTDQAGVAEFHDLPEGVSFEVVLFAASLGSAGPLELDFPAEEGEPVVLVLEADSGILVRFVDGNLPVPDVPCQIRDSKRDLPMGSGVTSDQDGVVRFTALAAGDYDLVAEKEGYWPVRQRVTALPDPAVRDVTIRRLGDVRIHLRGADGAPLGRVRFDLTSVEFDADVSEWVAAGRVSSEPEALTTNPRGELVLRGLPHGSYRWRLGSSSGVLEVSGGREDERYVLLP